MMVLFEIVKRITEKVLLVLRYGLVELAGLFGGGLYSTYGKTAGRSRREPASPQTASPGPIRTQKKIKKAERP